MFLLILLLLKINIVIKKQNSKKIAIKTFNFNNKKAIFKLLRKIITFYIKIIIIYIQRSIFENFL